MMKMIVAKAGVIVGELVAGTNTEGRSTWDAHAINPLTGEKKLLDTFTLQKDGDGMKLLREAERQVRSFKWKTNEFPVAKGSIIESIHNDTFDCPEVRYTRGKSSIRFILRKDDPNEADANVIFSDPTTQKDTLFLVELFTETHKSIERITNQVSNLKELKAFWNSKFFYGELRKWDDHVKALEERGSIMLTWLRPTDWHAFIKEELARPLQ
jgi:hypothetical protein